MKYSGTTLVAAALSLAAVATAQEDSLYSKRNLGKRFFDDQGNYNMSFYHINDVHAHLAEFKAAGTDCTNVTVGCFGGYARVKSVIDSSRPDHPDSLFLNVGDEFQGTLYYSYYGGEKIAETLNQLGFDGMTLGNHEFDGGDDKLGAFLANLTNIPIISANIQSNHTILNATIKPFHIYPQFGLAVIGVTTPETPSISSPGAGTTFSDPIKAVQDTINFIKATTNITRIAAITHIGYEEDQKLAKETTGLQLIMGGHSHTLLGDMPTASGKYPTIVENKAGDEVFIVTAYRWGEYLGYIDVTYDPSGKILAYHGAPIHLNNKTSEDAELKKEIIDWAGPFKVFAAEVLGESSVELDQTTCRAKECTLGNFMADAMLEYRLNVSDTADFALINNGGIRASIDVGPVTRGEVLTSFPFGNSIVEIELSGEDLWKTLEGVYSAFSQFNQKILTSKIQVSRGVNITWDSTRGNGTKLVSVDIGGKSLDRATTYNIVTLDFLAGGGDNIFVKQTNLAALDTQDQVLTNYVASQSPIQIGIEGRIVDLNGTAPATTSGTPSGTGAAPSSTATVPPSAGTRLSGSLSVAYAVGVAAIVVCASSISWM